MGSSRILVTGADGQVGRALARLRPDADLRAHHDLDVTDADAVERAAEDVDIIVHLAAMTDVDRCEDDPRTAELVNAHGTSNVVAAARRHGARVVYLSTDYVFPGDDPPYAEQDPTRPINAYGRSKLGGERHLDPENDLVVRTSWIFGDGHNFVGTILRAAATGNVTVVDDQIGRPTAADDLARALDHLLTASVSGCIHVAGDGTPCSWADFADLVIGVAGYDSEVERVSTEAYAARASKRVAPRPPNSTLDIEHARELGVPLVDWRTSVITYVKGMT